MFFLSIAFKLSKRSQLIQTFLEIRTTLLEVGKVLVWCRRLRDTIATQDGKLTAVLFKFSASFTQVLPSSMMSAASGVEHNVTCLFATDFCVYLRPQASTVFFAP